MTITQREGPTTSETALAMLEQGGYDQNQRNAVRLICSVCGKPWDVTHPKMVGTPFVCPDCPAKVKP
jgi:hypothetical protein